ncbi:hypothetical protein DICPUDRAFT_159603 [Dictyostelium purpureum]|uniref:Carbohydrate-binding domain-containing protein n=1 Tax=Dictyostelium purpureum TaxID=5786 RepID=F1A4I6_DICPU|nr:uncharacterized protein DICPUDRAFT_159603 [Dictyostelium purpureum]EGC28890.1 hypothetical protein DICPUDRAFT_159603 [Dictyostelium purpureum]|eukprot:XP_003294582.1 hypothetical protein DICPUDRAFT_159603 [Dictyostelium purpureum]
MKLLSILLLVLAIKTISSQFVDNLKIYKCSESGGSVSWSNATTVTDFEVTSNMGLAIQQTFASICYDDEYLRIKANCIDNNIISPYNQCNQDLFDADVFEIFLAYTDANSVAVNYLEVELSPYGVLFVSSVYNPNDACVGIQDNLVDCDQSGIIYEAGPVTSGWSGELSIPFSLIQKASGNPSGSNNVYKLNMFRIDVPQYGYKEYSCYHADNTNPPCFHVPSYFGALSLN